MLSLIGAAFCFISLVAAINDDGPLSIIFAHLEKLDSAYQNFFNLDVGSALINDSRHGFLWEKLSQRLLPFGELARSMPDLAKRMSQADAVNRAASLQLGRILSGYHRKIVHYDSNRDMLREYDNKMLPALYDTFASLVNETQLVRERAGNFAGSCRHNRIDKLILKFDAIFRENCEINCKQLNMSGIGSSCILEMLAFDSEYRKKDVNATVQRYDRDLMVLLITATFCAYSNDEIRDGYELSHTISRQRMQIRRIAEHMFEYVNWKMSEIWPNRFMRFTKSALDEYLRRNSYTLRNEDYYEIPVFVQERLNEIGDYRHGYQVLITSAKTLSFVSTDVHNVFIIPDQHGIDCLVVRHKVGSWMTKRAQKAHSIMEYYYFEVRLEDCKFRPNTVRDDLKDLGKSLNLTLPSQLTYSTVAVQQSGPKSLIYGPAYTNYQDFWSITHLNETDSCPPYRLFLLL